MIKSKRPDDVAQSIAFLKVAEQQGLKLFLLPSEAEFFRKHGVWNAAVFVETKPVPRS